MASCSRWRSQAESLATASATTEALTLVAGEGLVMPDYDFLLVLAGAALGTMFTLAAVWAIVRAAKLEEPDEHR